MTGRGGEVGGVVNWVLGKAHAAYERRRHEAALQRYGWDGICPTCKRWLHTAIHPDTTCFQETVIHWHYRCGHCGGLSHWALWGMLPILDMEHGAAELAKATPGAPADRGEG